MLKLQFLGTSAGMPTKSRNVSALAISCVNPYSQKKDIPWLLIDCGEATQHQLLKTSLSLLNLKCICITHVHGDHCYGLAGLLSSMAMLRRTQPITIIAPAAIKRLIEVLIETTALYLPYPIEFISIEEILELETDQQYTLQFSDHHQLTLELIPLSHRTASYAFKLSQSIQHHILDTQKLTQLNIPPSPIWKTLQRGQDVVLEDGTTLLAIEFCHSQTEHVQMIVGGDNDRPELLTPAMQHVVLVVHEATYTDEIAQAIKQRNPVFDPQHSSSKQVACFAQSLNLPYLILTHFSGRYASHDDPDDQVLNMGHLRKEVERYYNGQYWLAEDFLSFEVSATEVVCQGKLCKGS